MKKHTSRSRALFRALLLASWATATGCTTLPNQAEMEARAAAAAQQAQDNASLLANIEQSLEKLKQQDMAFWAPLHWQLANDSVTAAKTLTQEGAPDVEARKSLLVAQECLDKMADTRRIALTELKDLIAEIKQLQSIEAPQAFPKDYAEVVEDIRTLMKKIDAADKEGIQSSKDSLLADIRALEIATISYQQTEATEKVLKEAASDDTDELAEQSYERAEEQLEATRQLIAKNSRDMAAIESAARAAWIEAKHAHAIGTEAQTIAETLDVSETDSLEAVLLRFESLLTTASAPLELGDIRYMNLKQQADTIARHITASHGRQPAPKPSAEYRTYIYPPANVDASALWLPLEFQPQ